MFGKVKKWLGIEGVKVELVLPEELQADSKLLEGKLRFYSLNAQSVSRVGVKLIERYTRGRGEEKTTDEYLIGEISLDNAFDVPAEQAVEIDFQLPFIVTKSEMDEMQDKNIVMGGLVKAAKWFSGVNSEFRVEAEAEVKGVALNPFDKQPIAMK